jgi:hypothetical protein
LSLGVLMVLTGCATARHQEALYEAAHEYVYRQPIETVWPQIVKFVAAQGYPPRKGDEESVLVTEWRNDMQESRVVSSASRLYAEGFRLSDNTCAVRIFRQTVFTGNKGEMNAHENALTGSMTVGAAGDVSPFADDPIRLNQFLNVSEDHTPLTRAPAQLDRSFGRDGELEWKLLQYIDAEAAQTIEGRLAEQEKQ